MHSQDYLLNYILLEHGSKFTKFIYRLPLDISEDFKEMDTKKQKLQDYKNDFINENRRESYSVLS